MPIMLFLILILIFVILLVVVTNIVIVPQSMVYVVERLGSYSETWSAGLHVKIPFLERVAKKVSLKEQVADFPPQPVITRDNVTMQIDTVVFFQVMDAKLYTYGVNQPIAAIESLSATTLRNIIGEMELDHTLTSRDTINSKITAILDEATDKWGIKVNRVEVKNIIPPREIQEAMEKQMKAEREKRAVILKADGEKQAAITAAEGEKESAILRADAVKQQRILEAEGEAQAILAVQKANADAIRLLNEAMPTDKVPAQSGSAGQGRQRQGHQDHHPFRFAESGRRRPQHQRADDRPQRCGIRGFSYDLRYPEQSPQLSRHERQPRRCHRVRHGPGHQQSARWKDPHRRRQGRGHGEHRHAADLG